MHETIYPTASNEARIFWDSAYTEIVANITDKVSDDYEARREREI